MMVSYMKDLMLSQKGQHKVSLQNINIAGTYYYTDDKNIRKYNFDCTTTHRFRLL